MSNLSRKQSLISRRFRFLRWDRSNQHGGIFRLGDGTLAMARPDYGPISPNEEDRSASITLDTNASHMRAGRDGGATVAQPAPERVLWALVYGRHRQIV